MPLKTYDQMKAKLQGDMDLIDEPFLPSSELVRCMNEAIKDAETAIHNFGIEANYFRAPAFLNLVNNQQPYSLPTDIYANKILGMFYQSPPPTTVLSGTSTISTAVLVMSSATGISIGQFVFGTGVPLFTRVIGISGTSVTVSQPATASGTVSFTFVSIMPSTAARQYEIHKMRDIRQTFYNHQGDDYTYLIVNSQIEAGGNQIVFYPTPNEDGPQVMLWYIREVRAITETANDPNNVLEIAECENFLYAHCKWNIALKSGRMVQERKEARNQQYQLMMETLAEMIPDGDTKVRMDLSSYYNQEMDFIIGG